MKTLQSGSITCMLFFLQTVPTLQAAEQSQAELLVAKAQVTMSSFAADANAEWLLQTARKAMAIMLIPQSIKGAFLVGGSGGSGVMLARSSEAGEWSYPAFYTLGAVSVGLQIGGESSEIMLMVMTDRGMERLLASSFKLGADLSVAAGPVGGGVTAKTADIYSYSKSKGAFVGASLDGAMVKTRDDLNTQYYGLEVRPADILVRSRVANLQADPLREALADFIGN